MSSQGNEPEDVRVEHILAALDQITSLCAHVRSVLEGMDPKTVVRARTPIGSIGPSGKPLASQCMVHDKE